MKIADKELNAQTHGVNRLSLLRHWNYSLAKFHHVCVKQPSLVPRPIFQANLNHIGTVSGLSTVTPVHRCGHSGTVPVWSTSVPPVYRDGSGVIWYNYCDDKVT